MLYNLLAMISLSGNREKRTAVDLTKNPTSYDQVEQIVTLKFAYLYCVKARHASKTILGKPANYSLLLKKEQFTY